ncbi:MAG: response regulator [Calditrichales bacterium]|nr:response regulator [Calditrichales bacterium]
MIENLQSILDRQQERYEKKKMLIIDDDEALLELLSIYLRDENYEVAIAYNARTGLEMASQNDYALVLIDLKLPDGSGLDLISKFRDKSKVIIITGYPDLKYQIEAKKRGASGFIIKPFLIDDMVRKLNETVGRL